MKPSQATALFAGNVIVVGGQISPETMDKLGAIKSTPGCTLWDLYAAMALNGLLACPDVDGNHTTLPQSAADYASALLAERARREKEAE